MEKYICTYCGMPVCPPFSYHAKGDCLEAVKLVAPDLIELARDIDWMLVHTDYLNANVFDKLERIISNLRDKKFI